jgi:regulator of protease activity HflC (stomatin/prohibitin superfamily)
MFFSRQFNPQWDQAMRDAAQEALNQQQSQADAEMAQLLATEQAEDAAIRAKGQADMQRLTSEHQAFMNQMDEQSAARNANFAAYEAQKGLNNWNFIAHDVRNGALYRDNETGKIFEIDN